jgi:hypothetical protein
MNNAENAFLGSLVLSVPLAMISPVLGNSGNSRHLFHLVVGLAMVYAVCGLDTAHSLVTSLSTYALVRLGLPWLVPPLAFLYQLTMRTMPSVFTGASTVSGPCNAIQLVLTLKLVSFAFEGGAGRRAGAGLVGYLGWIYFFPGLMTGPFCSFGDYLDAISGETLRRAGRAIGREVARPWRYDDMSAKFLKDECLSRGLMVGPNEETKEKLAERLRDHDADAAVAASGLADRPPPTVVPALRRALQAVPFGAAYLAAQRYAPFSRVLEASFVRDQGWLARAGYSWVSVRAFGYRFLFAWLLAEAACIAAGVAFSGYANLGRRRVLDEPIDGEYEIRVRAEYGKTENIHILGVELATDLPSVFRHWNISVHHWIRAHVFGPVAARTGSRAGAQVAAYLTLAYWHGLRPGYYLYFLTVPFLVWVSGTVSAAADALGLRGPGRAAAGWALTQTAIAYMSSAFIALDWDKTIAAWSAVGWYGHLGAAALGLGAYMVVVAAGGPQKAKARANNKDKGKTE